MNPPTHETAPLALERVRHELSKIVVGLEGEIELALAALLAEGHVLLEGPPGVAKTLFVKALAAALGLAFGRVQFTPDLMPADVTGTSVFRPADGSFRFEPGPLFAEIVLCDEINRAGPKTQSALLEAMAELTVSIGRERHALPRPFAVFATQNPLEHEGTYPLPEAQLDRFLFKLLFGYPSSAVEAELLLAAHGRGPAATPVELGVRPVVTREELGSLIAAAQSIAVAPELAQYVVRLLRATREERALSLGASPRAGVALLRAAKALALLGGRDFATTDDVKRLVPPTWRHRLRLEPGEELEGASVENVLERLLDRVEVPR